MKSSIYILIVSLFLLVTGGCEKEEPVEEKEDFPEYLIFGHFSGECEGAQCVEIYKIQNDSLFVAEDIYPTSLILYEGGPYEAEFVAIENSRAHSIAEIKEKFPDELWREPAGDMGCPDCVDQGGYFVEISTKSFQRNWRIDKDRKNVPAYLYPFLDEIDEKLEILNH